jgi:hypothetical protein
MLCSNGFSERGKERREKRIDEQKRELVSNCWFVVSTFSSLAGELWKRWSVGGKTEVGEERRTLEDVARQITLVLAAAGSGGGTVWVRVLPLLEEFLGLVEQDLAREGESVDCVPEGMIVS